MRCFIGIDLGSTTTKAVVIRENQNILGRGITTRAPTTTPPRRSPSRRRWSTAASTLSREARQHNALNGALDGFIAQLERDFRSEQYLEQLADLEKTCERSLATARFGDSTGAVGDALAEVFRRLTAEAPLLFAPGAKRKSDFFRDIAGSQYLATGEVVAKEVGTRYDYLLNLFDRSIIEVENASMPTRSGAPAGRAGAHLRRLAETTARRAEVEAPIKGILDTELEETYIVAPATAARACRSPRSTSAPRSCATAWARTSCTRERPRCWTSAARTPRQSRSTRPASSRASR